MIRISGIKKFGLTAIFFLLLYGAVGAVPYSSLFIVPDSVCETEPTGTCNGKPYPSCVCGVPYPLVGCGEGLGWYCPACPQVEADSPPCEDYDLEIQCSGACLEDLVHYPTGYCTLDFVQLYGNNFPDEGFSVVPTSTGRYLVAAEKGKTTAAAPSGADTDAWLIGAARSDGQLLSEGFLPFASTASYDWASAFDINENAGFTTLVGASYSPVSGHGLDVYLAHLDSGLLFEKWIGGNGSDAGYALVPVTGGFVMAGTTSSFGGTADVWLVKTNMDGDTCDFLGTANGSCTGTGPLAGTFVRRMGGAGADIAYDLVSVSDGFVLVGSTTSFSSARQDLWVLKTNLSGDTCSFGASGSCTGSGALAGTFVRRIGGTGADVGRALVKVSDGLVISGYSDSPGLNEGGDGFGGFDLWMLKLDFSGNSVWSKMLGGGGSDMGYAVQTDSDGLLFGGMLWQGPQAPGALNGLYDAWLAKTDSTGTLQWDFAWGLGGSDYTNSILVDSGSYVLAGTAFASYLPSLKNQAFLLKLSGCTEGSVCGDGVAQSGEECDWGTDCLDGFCNRDVANSCRTNCSLPACGDGIPDPLFSESCDDGGLCLDGATPCTTLNEATACTGGPSDYCFPADGSQDGGNCSNACRIEGGTCGDGVCNAAEDIFSCPLDCGTCGDGFVDADGFDGVSGTADDEACDAGGLCTGNYTTACTSSQDCADPEAGGTCTGVNLNGQTCADLVSGSSGMLSCYPTGSSNPCQFDTRACTAAPPGGLCNNGICLPPEDVFNCPDDCLGGPGGVRDIRVQILTQKLVGARSVDADQSDVFNIGDTIDVKITIENKDVVPFSGSGELRFETSDGSLVTGFSPFSVSILANDSFSIDSGAEDVVLVEGLESGSYVISFVLSDNDSTYSVAQRKFIAISSAQVIQIPETNFAWAFVTALVVLFTMLVSARRS